VWTNDKWVELMVVMQTEQHTGINAFSSAWVTGQH
jgi:hypothetical protein